MSDTSYKTTMDDMKNGKRTSTPSSTAAIKRYSIDNYCSNWLSNTFKLQNDLDSNNVHEKNHSSSSSTSSAKAASDKTTATAANGHEHQLRLNKLHRRSLSENVIPFPPHTTPSDKARCHLINRRNSHLNASSGNSFLLCPHNGNHHIILHFVTNCLRFYFYLFALNAKQTQSMSRDRHHH